MKEFFAETLKKQKERRTSQEEFPNGSPNSPTATPRKAGAPYSV
jgi:hypothetical protein